LKLTEKGVIIGICIFLCVVFVTAALNDPYPWFGYDEEWMIGKTAAQIQKRYGEFDHEYQSADGEYLREARYILRPRKWWHYKYGLWLEIHFDENGVAVSTHEDHGVYGG